MGKFVEEGDLRNLSYFLNKRKEFEFYTRNPANLQYLATLVRGKVTKTKELQGTHIPEREMKDHFETETACISARATLLNLKILPHILFNFL